MSSRSFPPASTASPASRPGFKTAIHTDVALTVDQIQRLDMQLAPGNVTETVEVHVERARARYRQRVGGSHDHREAGHRAAAQRPQLPAAAVPRRRRRRDRRRTGGHAPGGRQCHQHHGRAADVEQLHDRRHGEHRHLARHARGGAVGGCHPGVQGTDHDLLGGIRVQLEPGQPGQQDRHQRAARHGLRVLQERRLGRAGTSSTTRPRRRRSSIRSSSGSWSAGR